MGSTYGAAVSARISYVYLRARQACRRQTKIVWQQYIGHRAELVRRLQQGATPERLTIREFGASTVSFKIANEPDRPPS